MSIQSTSNTLSLPLYFLFFPSSEMEVSFITFLALTLISYNLYAGLFSSYINCAEIAVLLYLAHLLKGNTRQSYRFSLRMMYKNVTFKSINISAHAPTLFLEYANQNPNTVVPTPAKNSINYSKISIGFLKTV